MATAAQRIIEQAKRLPARERRRVVSELEASLKPRAGRRSRRTAGASSYDALIALTGTARSDVADVSTDKYPHLAAAYADDET
jgi:hypothetical protein